MNNFITRCLFLAVFLLGCQGESNNSLLEKKDFSSTDNSPVFEEIDGYIEKLVQNGQTAGVSWGIQIGDGNPFVKAYGFADVEKEIPVQPSTSFGLASVTKPFTATAVAILIERGLLTLEDSLTKFFPAFPGGENVTIYHLLSHTSGIPDWWVGGLPETISENWTLEAEPHRYLEKMNTVSLFEPGTQYSYSNSGYLLLGEIIEQVSGYKYGDFLYESIFKPTNMDHTGLVSDESAIGAIGYSTVEEGDSLSESKFIPVSFPARTLKSAGGLASTIDDMLSWTDALFGGKLIRDTLLAEMISYANVEDGRPVYEAVYYPPGMPESPPLDYMKKNGYGLGFTRTEMFGKPVIWHSGGMPGFNTIWVHIPDSQTTLVILSNTDNGAVSAFEDIIRAAAQL